MTGVAVHSAYFSSKAAASSRATSYSLADLKVGQADTAEAQQLLASLPTKHAKAKQQLLQQYESQFRQWAFQLHEGFSLLFHGFGSKKALLERFAVETLTDGGVIAFSGLKPSVTAKQVLLQAAGLLKGNPASAYKGMDAAGLLHLIAHDCTSARIYILLHNIEGPGLRAAASQATLAALAACPRVHLIASFDHVNTPILWDKQTAARFNWLHHDVTTYKRYYSETLTTPSLLVGRSEERQAQGAIDVLRSLVPHAREVFRIIASQQVEGTDESGITFDRLFRACREKFLVSAEINLKSHLAEFKDHDLVQTRRGIDGTDMLCVPMSQDAIVALLLELDADR